MSVHDLLIAMMLPSADDAAEDLAYNVGHGSVARFLAMMNARAGQLGLTHTHYTTPIGLDTPGNYSSAGDLVTLARYLLQGEPFFKAVVALPRDDAADRQPPPRRSEPQRPGGEVLVDQRGQDRAHAATPGTCSSCPGRRAG